MYAEAPIYDSPAGYTPRLPSAYSGLPPAIRTCRQCFGEGWHGKSPDGAESHCGACNGVGYHGVDLGPCDAPKGSELRVLVYRGRYMANLPIFNPLDSREHVTSPLNHEHREPHWSVPELHDVEFDDEEPE